MRKTDNYHKISQHS